jgi:conjugal transfer pilus assembly protein TraV
MPARSSLALVSALALSGCVLFHSNIKGGFACAAPRGTCAPSTVIDDTALRSIGAQKFQSDGNTQSSPGDSAASPDEAQDTGPKAKTGKAWLFVAGARPALKLVYPSWRDGAGQFHQRTTAYTPIDVPPMASSGAIPIEASQLGAAGNANLLAVAEMAPDMALLAPETSATARGNPAIVEVPAKHAPSNPAAVQAGLGAPTAPLDTIKEQVKQILSAAPKPPALKPALKTDAAQVKTGASFPPSGN